MTTALGALGSRLSTFVRQTLLSVVVPGLVLLFELWVIAGRPKQEWVEDPHPLAIGLVVYFGYTIGYAARYVAFCFADAVGMLGVGFRRHPAFAKEARPILPFGQSLWGRAFYRRRAFGWNMALLRATYGPEAVDAALASHPLAVLVDGRAGDPEAEDDDIALRELFHYCKTYLCLRAPALSTETREVELNTHLGAVLPVALAPWAASTGGLGGQATGMAAGIAGLVTVILVLRANYLRHTEVFDVVRNLLFARWLDMEVPPPHATVRAPEADSPEDPHSSEK